MTYLPVTMVTCITLIGILVVICVALWFEVNSLQDQNADLRHMLGSIARMEKLNSRAVYGLLQEVSQLPQKRGHR